MNPKPRILIVEDEAIVALDLGKRLAALGYTVAGKVASGEAALAGLEAARPDVVLMDIHLGSGLDGIAAAQQLRQRVRVPVVFVTAYAEDATLDRATLAEPYGYILKPFEDRELKTVIEMAIYKHAADEEILRLNRLYAVLSQVNAAIVRCASRGELLPAICRAAVELGQFRLAWVGRLEAADRRIVPVASAGDEYGYVAQLNLSADPAAGREGLSGAAIRTGSLCISSEFGTDLRLTPWHELAARAGIRSGAAAPIRLRGVVWSTLSVYAAEPGFFQPAEVRLIEEIAATVSFALDRLADHELQQSAAAAHAKLEEQFRQAQKMEAVGRLAGGVAHDVNNLMTVVIGYSDMALAECQRQSPLRANLEEIRAAGRQTADLARQLLAFGRRQVLQPRTLDLHAALTGLERMLHRLIGEDIALTVAPAAGSTWVTLDPIQFEQVVMNLAVNARDAMPKGGALTMAAAAVEADADFLARHPEAKPGAYVRLTVSDAGCGMTDDVKAHLFEPFFTTKESGKGTGLGLSTVFGIVTQSGGFIDVDSAVGQGTRFILHFPAAAAPVAGAEEPAAPAPAAPEAAAPAGETILVVEDSGPLRELLLALLAERGYAVVDAADGQAAIALAAKYAGIIHLLLTDVVLPGMSGPELAQQLQARFPALRVLYMSGYAGEAIAQHGVLDADAAFIPKPFTADELAAKIRDTLERPGKTTMRGTKHRR